MEDKSSSKIADLEKTMKEFKNSTLDRMDQLEQAIETFTSADSHIDVLKDMSKFKKKMEK